MLENGVQRGICLVFTAYIKMRKEKELACLQAKGA